MFDKKNLKKYQKMLDLYLKLYYNYVRGGGVALIKKAPLKKY